MPSHHSFLLSVYCTHLQYNTKLCVNGSVFGRPHRGGWYACGDDLFNLNNKENKVEGKEKEENEKKGKCVVYSYGLGADW